MCRRHSGGDGGATPVEWTKVGLFMKGVPMSSSWRDGLHVVCLHQRIDSNSSAFKDGRSLAAGEADVYKYGDIYTRAARWLLNISP